jgi:hypothetical protein
MTACTDLPVGGPGRTVQPPGRPGRCVGQSVSQIGHQKGKTSWLQTASGGHVGDVGNEEATVEEEL